MSIIGNGVSVGGGGINVRVVRSIPATGAKENMILLATNTNIGGVFVTYAPPSSPSNGDVWVCCDSSTGSKRISYESKGGKQVVDILPFFCWQYENDAWAPKEAQIYKNSTWEYMAYCLADERVQSSLSDWAGYAYEANGMTASVSKPDITLSDGNIYASFASGTRGSVVFNSVISFANYNTAQFTCSTTRAVRHEFGCTETLENKYTWAAWQQLDTSGDHTFTVDVSSYSGDAYLLFGAWGNGGIQYVTAKQMILLP